MKKLLIILTVLILMFSVCKKSNAATYQEAINKSNSTPAMVLVYANWADNYQKCINNIEQVKKYFGDKYNYVVLDIATDETKAFNKTNSIYTNLPYILLMRANGKVQRYLDNNCSQDAHCIIEKGRMFIGE